MPIFNSQVPAVDVSIHILYLELSHVRWQNETLVVAMDHNQNPDRSGSDSPRVLVRILLFTSFGIFEGNVEHLGEILSQVM